MKTLLESLLEFAESDDSGLVVGERGSGREWIARVLHQFSVRKKKGFVSVQAGVAPYLFSKKDCVSPVTLERANGGTLLVKSLCDLSPAGQKVFKRVLKPTGRKRQHVAAIERYDVRVIGSTTVDLEDAVEGGFFSPELYGQLGARCLRVPPLRNRAEDIPRLVELSVRDYAKKLGRDPIAISVRAIDRLVDYSWPGNVAELKSVCRRLVLRTKSCSASVVDVDKILHQVVQRVPVNEVPLEDFVRGKIRGVLEKGRGEHLVNLYQEAISRVERPLLEVVMEYTGNNQMKAAQILGLNRATLRRKLSEHELQAPKRTRRRTVAKSATLKKSR